MARTLWMARMLPPIASTNLVHFMFLVCMTGLVARPLAVNLHILVNVFTGTGSVVGTVDSPKQSHAGRKGNSFHLPCTTLCRNVCGPGGGVPTTAECRECTVLITMGSARAAVCEPVEQLPVRAQLPTALCQKCHSLPNIYSPPVEIESFFHPQYT